MNQLIKITESNGRQVVSARDLYEFLEVNTAFTNWCKRMFEYDFQEGRDFMPILAETYSSIGGRPSTDYALTLECAKEISMLQRTDKGKQARRYFIEIEKRFVSQMVSLEPEEIMLQQLQMIVAQKKRLTAVEQDVKELKAQSITRPNWFTVAGYGTLTNVSVGVSLAASLGKKASKLCKERGITVESIPDPRFGKVHVYPENILQIVFNQQIN